MISKIHIANMHGLAQLYNNSKPFKHVVFENFLETEIYKNQKIK